MPEPRLDIAVADPAWITPADRAEADAAQRAMADRALFEDLTGEIAVVAGADASMGWRDSMGPVSAAIAPLALATRQPLPPGTATVIPTMPYIPGYLGFREVPALVAAWRTIVTKPDLIFVDGQGYAHPRRCGVAVQLGVTLDVPAIGVAKSVLCGSLDRDVGEEPGGFAWLVDRGERVAMALRTRRRAKPIYISPGHRQSLDSAVEWVRRLCDGRRLPLPTRLAHDAANAARVKAAGGVQWKAADLPLFDQ